MSQRDTRAATKPFVPAARAPAPAYSSAEIAVAAPPAANLGSRAGFVVRLLPVLMALATVGMTVTVMRSGAGVGHQPTFLIFPAMMTISAVIAAVTNRDGCAREVNAARAQYLNYLAGLRDSVAANAAAQNVALRWCHPEPSSLWTLVGGRRMWERRPADPDFAQVRVGLGNQPSAARLVPAEEGPAENADPVTSGALRAFTERHAAIQDAPIVVDLRGQAAVTVEGQLQPARALLRAMICQLAVLHPPNVLLVAAAVSSANQPHWEWLKWLPHNQHPQGRDAAGSVRMMYPGLGAAEAAVAGLLDRSAQSTSVALPQVLIIVDGGVVDGPERAVREPMAGVTVCEIAPSGVRPAGVRLQVTATELLLSHAGDREVVVRPDQLDAVAALTCARLLAGYHIGAQAVLDAWGGDGWRRWQDLVGAADLDAFDPAALWRSRSHRDRLRVPVGTTISGAPVELDIKEAAESGIGPHGLCIGATGSGKSEFLRTVVLGMMTRHSPEQLNLVLVDFKGGATFRGLEHAPHVAALITNLAGEATLVERMRDALAGEMNRRQEMLRAAGSLVSVSAYEQTRSAGAQLAALPVLLIIVDEFSELLAQQPDFADMFGTVGRLGRSLGMHLLLASQRLDEGRLRGLESHLSYRICLKTLTSNESRIVLGTTDAYQLPNTPGAAILRSASDELVWFQTAFVSACCPTTGSPEAHRDDAPPRARMFNAAPTGAVNTSRVSRVSFTTERTVLQTVVDRLSGYGPRAHEIWLPPLGLSPALNTVLNDATPNTGGLRVPVGVVDRPFEQRRTPLTINLAGAAGNVAVVGAPQSGKSTALRTLVTALAVTHDPSQAQFYCLDFGGGALGSLRSLPHTGSVAGGAEPDLVIRTVAHLESIVRRRERFFEGHGIESMAHYRRRRAEGESDGDGFGDVFLVVDGWAILRRQFDTLEGSVTALALAGLAFGVHIVLSAPRWADLRPALKDAIGTRIELRLGEATDSDIDRKAAEQVPRNQPGRGLSAEGLHMLIAVPRLEGIQSVDGLAEAAAQLGRSLRHRYGDLTAPPLRLLPTHVDRRELVGQVGTSLAGEVLLGLDGDESRPLGLDFASQAHLLVLGDNGCGKTTTLRTLCQEITRTRDAARVRLFVVDFRRGLFEAAGPGHLGGYAMSPAALAAFLPDLIDLLRNRMAPPQATMEQLRARSWWSGPEIYLVVDDYDLVATASGNPLTPLTEYLPYADDVGLHLVVARRAAGAARALFEPLLAALRDLGAAGLMMSGTPEEGPLIGSHRPMPLPPGRGTLITRHGEERLVQVAWTPAP